jgi:ubiquinone/menaquinone biosynthesis C-methylase UbiE
MTQAAVSRQETWQVHSDAALLYEQSFVPAIFAASAEVLADFAGIGRGERVLDVGCGTGAVARAAARRVGAEGRVVGLDLNPRMLAVARRVAPEIEWCEGEAGDLPFEPNTFDVVTSQYALMFVPDQPQALAEMWRVLAPSGRLALAVCGPIARAPGYAALAEVAAGCCPAEVVELLRSPFALGDQEQLARLVCAAGIEDARIDTTEIPVRFPSIDALVETEIMASPIREVIEQRDYAALRAGARTALSPWCRPDGAVGFPLAAHIVSGRKA